MKIEDEEVNMGVEDEEKGEGWKVLVVSMVIIVVGVMMIGFADLGEGVWSFVELVAGGVVLGFGVYCFAEWNGSRWAKDISRESQERLKGSFIYAGIMCLVAITVWIGEGVGEIHGKVMSFGKAGEVVHVEIEDEREREWVVVMTKEGESLIDLWEVSYLSGLRRIETSSFDEYEFEAVIDGQLVRFRCSDGGEYGMLREWVRDKK